MNSAAVLAAVSLPTDDIFAEEGEVRLTLGVSGDDLSFWLIRQGVPWRGNHQAAEL